MAATGGAGGMYAKRQSINNGQYAQDAYGMNNIRGSGAQTSVYSGTTNYTSHPSYGGGAGYYANELPPVPLHQNAYGRPSFGSTNAPGIAGVGAAGGNYGQDTQIGYRNAPGNSIGALLPTISWVLDSHPSRWNRGRLWWIRTQQRC